jgi:hypothetical protein
LDIFSFHWVTSTGLFFDKTILFLSSLRHHSMTKPVVTRIEPTPVPINTTVGWGADFFSGSEGLERSCIHG